METCGRIAEYFGRIRIPEFSSSGGFANRSVMTGSALILKDTGRTIPLAGAVTIGRQSSNLLVLTNDQVSRQHALIQWQRIGTDGDGGFLLIDLGSSNGTQLNGKRIDRPMPLRNGDLIDIGGHGLEFRGSDEAAVSISETLGSTALDIKKRNAWLMVGDLVGSTRRSRELPAEEVPRINGTWFKTCRDLVESHGGHMNQYLGDGFFCYWEDTLETKERLDDLLRRFAAMQRDSQPPFRIVLHFGITVLGSVPTMSSLNLHGANVNFVFRMEKLAGSLKEPVLLSRAAADKLGFAARSHHEAELSGFDGRHAFVVPALGDSGR